MPVGIEAYDLAMGAMFSDIRDYEGIEVIPLVWARPDLAFSDLSQVLNKTEEEVAQYQGSVPLPFLSLWRQDPEPDATRSNVIDRRYRGHYTDAEKTQGIRTTNLLPYNLRYQLELWCRDTFDANAVTDWVRWNFTRGEMTYLPITFDDPIGLKNIVTFFRSSVDNTDLETEEVGYHRITMDFEVQGWFLGPSKVAKTVLTTQLDVYADEEVDNSLFDSALDSDGNPHHTTKLTDGLGSQTTAPAQND